MLRRTRIDARIWSIPYLLHKGSICCFVTTDLFQLFKYIPLNYLLKYENIYKKIEEYCLSLSPNVIRYTTKNYIDYSKKTTNYASKFQSSQKIPLIKNGFLITFIILISIIIGTNKSIILTFNSHFIVGTPFNAPRIFSEKSLNPLNPEDTSFALIQGRKQIRRLMNFAKKYLPGFENAYISQIASQLGIRDSRRIECEYCLTEEDILSAKKFDNPVAKSNYPIDVHSREKNKSILDKLKEYEYFEIPLEALMVKGFDNLFVVGKTISTTFLAQAAIRIIPNCLTMGENLGKYINNALLNIKNICQCISICTFDEIVKNQYTSSKISMSESISFKAVFSDLQAGFWTSDNRP